MKEKKDKVKKGGNKREKVNTKKVVKENTKKKRDMKENNKKTYKKLSFAEDDELSLHGGSPLSLHDSSSDISLNSGVKKVLDLPNPW